MSNSGKAAVSTTDPIGSTCLTTGSVKKQQGLLRQKRCALRQRVNELAHSTETSIGSLADDATPLDSEAQHEEGEQSGRDPSISGNALHAVDAWSEAANQALVRTEDLIPFRIDDPCGSQSALATEIHQMFGREDALPQKAEGFSRDGALRFIECGTQ